MGCGLRLAGLDQLAAELPREHRPNLAKYPWPGEPSAIDGEVGLVAQGWWAKTSFRGCIGIS
jgi:hypothetical protein